MKKEIENKIDKILDTRPDWLWEFNEETKQRLKRVKINKFHLKAAIQSLIEEVEKETKVDDIRNIIYQAIKDYIDYSYIDWQVRTVSHKGTATYIEGFIDSVKKFPDSNISKLL